MPFAPDVNEALGAAVALVNSAEPPETLDSVDALRAFYDEWGYTGFKPATVADLEAVRAIRPRLRRLLTEIGRASCRERV